VLWFQLDKTEAKEKADAEAIPVKALKGKKKAVAAETLPSQYGERIVPTLDDDTKKKVEKLDAAKTGIKVPRGRKVKFVDCSSLRFVNANVNGSVLFILLRES